MAGLHRDTLEAEVVTTAIVFSNGGEGVHHKIADQLETEDVENNKAIKDAVKEIDTLEIKIQTVVTGG